MECGIRHGYRFVVFNISSGVKSGNFRGPKRKKRDSRNSTKTGPGMRYVS
jgi:hypothetical protein